TGSVTSARSAARRADSSPRSSSALRASSASLMRAFRPLTAWPNALRWSAGSELSVAISSGTRPLRPSAAMRTRSMAARSAAAPISAISAPEMADSCVVSDIDVIPAGARWSAEPAPGVSGRGPDALPRQVDRNRNVVPRGLTPSAVTAGSSRLQLGGGLIDQGLEGGSVLHGDIGQHLAVHGNARKREAVDKSAVGQPVLAHGGVDALDPQGTEGALAPLAVAIGVLHRLFDRLLGDPDRVLAAAVVALGLLQDLLVLGVGGDAALDACHGSTPSGDAMRGVRSMGSDPWPLPKRRSNTGRGQ